MPRGKPSEPRPGRVPNPWARQGTLPPHPWPRPPSYLWEKLRNERLALRSRFIYGPAPLGSAFSFRAPTSAALWKIWPKEFWMARVTVEDCVDKVSNRFDLVLYSGYRARQLSGG